MGGKRDGLLPSLRGRLGGGAEMRVFLSFLLGCGGPGEPELSSYKQAITEFDQGTQAMEAGDLPTALAAFERAQAIRPSDVILGAWRAKVLADSGQLEAAIAELGKVVAARPNFTEARYNRAAYLARLERFDEAAKDIRKLLDAEAYTVADLYEDPDFEAALGDAAFAFVPKATVTGELLVPEHAVVHGTDVPVRLRLSSTTRLTGLDVTGTVTGPARLTRVLEEPFDGGVTVTWTLRVVGSGSVAVGPFWVEAAGAQKHQVFATQFETWTPPNRAEEEPRTVSLQLPSKRVGDRTPSDAWREGESVYVLISEGHKVETTPPAAVDAVIYERRRKGLADWVLLQYAVSADQKLGIQIKHRGQPVFEGQR
jgi:hypothetical protein